MAQKLVLCTASNEEIEKAVMSAFAKAHPGIKVEVINLPTGPVVQRAIAATLVIDRDQLDHALDQVGAAIADEGGAAA